MKRYAVSKGSLDNPPEHALEGEGIDLGYKKDSGYNLPISTPNIGNGYSGTVVGKTQPTFKNDKIEPADPSIYQTPDEDKPSGSSPNLGSVLTSPDLGEGFDGSTRATGNRTFNPRDNGGGSRNPDLPKGNDDRSGFRGDPNVLQTTIQDSSRTIDPDAFNKNTLQGTSSGRAMTGGDVSIEDAMSILNGQNGRTSDNSSENTAPENGGDDKNALGDLTDYQTSIDELTAMLMGGDLANFSKGLLSYLDKITKALEGGFGMKSLEAFNGALNLYNIAAAAINTRLQSEYELRNWTFQNDYNSPVQQMRRLMEAGINPAFYFASLNKSDASPIGQVNPNTANTNPVNPDTSDAQRLSAIGGMVGAAGGVLTGSLSAAGGLVQSIANAKFADENRIDIQETRPSRIAQMYGSAAATQAQASNLEQTTPEQVKNLNAQSYLMRQQSRNLREQIEVAKDNIEAMLAIAEMNNDTSLKVANIGSLAQKYAADKGYQGSLANLHGNSLLRLLEDTYDENTTTYYTDSATGQTYSRDELNQYITENSSEFGIQGGAAFDGLINIDVNGKASTKKSSLTSVKDGQSFYINGKKFTTSTKVSREFNPERYGRALEYYDVLWKGLREGRLTPAQYSGGISELFGVKHEEEKKMITKLSKYIADGMFKPILDNLPSQLNEEHFR